MAQTLMAIEPPHEARIQVIDGLVRVIVRDNRKIGANVGGDVGYGCAKRQRMSFNSKRAMMLLTVVEIYNYAKFAF